MKGTRPGVMWWDDSMEESGEAPCHSMATMAELQVEARERADAFLAAQKSATEIRAAAAEFSCPEFVDKDMAAKVVTAINRHMERAIFPPINVAKRLQAYIPNFTAGSVPAGFARPAPRFLVNMLNTQRPIVELASELTNSKVEWWDDPYDKDGGCDSNRGSLWSAESSLDEFWHAFHRIKALVVKPAAPFLAPGLPLRVLLPEGVLLNHWFLMHMQGRGAVDIELTPSNSPDPSLPPVPSSPATTALHRAMSRAGTTACPGVLAHRGRRPLGDD